MAEVVKSSSVKEEAIRMIQRLPDDCTLLDIQYHLAVLEKVGQGIRAIDEGRLVSQDEVERMSAAGLKIEYGNTRWLPNP